MIKKLILFLSFFYCCTFSYSQEDKQSNNATNSIIVDSLKPGSYKDVFTSFFQLAFDNLTSENRALSFKTNPFEIMARTEEKYFEADNWKKYGFLRDLNFEIGLGLDSAFKIDNLQLGFKAAIFNCRDISRSYKFLRLVDSLPEEKYKNYLYHLIDSLNNDIEALDAEMNEMFAANSKLKYKDLSIEMKQILKTAINQVNYKPFKKILNEKSDSTIYSVLFAHQNEVKENFLLRPLWTVEARGIASGPKATFSEWNLGTDFLVGLAYNKAKTLSYDLNISSRFRISDDSLSPINDLDRRVWNSTIGLNVILRDYSNYRPFMELNLAAGYQRVFSPLLGDEKQSQFYGKATYRIRLFNDFWLPIVVEYLPAENKFRARLNVVANFVAISDLFQNNRR